MILSVSGRILHITVVLTVMCCYIPSHAQVTDSVSKPDFWSKAQHYDPGRGRFIALSAGGLYTGGMIALYAAWYRDYPSSRFHYFNDNSEWFQMDKVGHCGTAYYLARWADECVEWTGLSSAKSAWWGIGISTVFLLTIETFDGFSGQWGYSAGDVAANTLGAGAFLGQELAWKEQRISIKLSYHKDELANQRPAIFGDNIVENTLKDYNGQTYWLSFNLASFMKQTKWPVWLNLAAGYGAGNMLTANESDEIEGLKYPGERYRQFFISPDIEWTKIPVKSKALKSLFSVLGFIKIPTPALEFQSRGNVIFHGLYF